MSNKNMMIFGGVILLAVIIAIVVAVVLYMKKSGDSQSFDSQSHNAILSPIDTIMTPTTTTPTTTTNSLPIGVTPEKITFSYLPSVDIPSYDIYMGTDVAKCETDCANTSNCTMYITTNDRKKCWVKSGAYNPQIITSFKTSAASVDGIKMDNNYAGYDYPSSDISNSKKDSLAECKTSCINNDKCTLVAYNTFDKTCWLKSASINPDRHIYFKNKNLDTGSYVKYNNTDIPSNVNFDYNIDPTGTVVASELDCSQLCDKNNECKFYTYTPTNKNCRLKKTKTGNVNFSSGLRVSSDTFKSMPLSSTIIPSSDIGAFSLITKQQSDCEQKCREDQSCKMYVYDNTTAAENCAKISMKPTSGTILGLKKN
jgi:hypothetical protein